MLTSDHVELLLTIVDTGSFSAAARALGRTPSAVSMMIGNIEAELGLTLFDRSKRDPAPTTAMLALLPDARLIMDRLHTLRSHVHDLSDGVEDKLSLGLAADVNSEPIMRALVDVARRYPALEIHIVTAPQDAIVAALHHGAVDFCVAYGGLDLDTQESIHALWTENVLAVAAPGHMLSTENAKLQPIERLMAHRQIVVASPGTPLADIRPVIGSRTWKTDSLATAISLVKAGHGWANFPESMIGDLVAEGELVPLRFTNITNGLMLPVYLRQLKHVAPGKAAQMLIAGLRSAHGKIEAPG